MDFPGKATRNTCKKWQKMAHFTSLHFSGFGLGGYSRHFALNNTHCQGVWGAEGRAERKAHWESKAQKENARLTLPHFLLADLEFAVVWKWKYRNATLSLLLLNLIRMYVYVCVCRYMYIYIRFRFCFSRAFALRTRLKHDDDYARRKFCTSRLDFLQIKMWGEKKKKSSQFVWAGKTTNSLNVRSLNRFDFSFSFFIFGLTQYKQNADAFVNRNDRKEGGDAARGGAASGEDVQENI